MRKSLTSNVLEHIVPVHENWLDLESTASVEVTSEDDSQPVEGALLPNDRRGWRAGGPGTQTLWLVFDKPQTLRRIWLVFEETTIKRTQEFVLRWSVHVSLVLLLGVRS